MEMNISQTREYLIENHGLSFEPSTITKWMTKGYLNAWQDVSHRWFTTRDDVERAIKDGGIPPRIGKSRTYTVEQKNRMKRLREEGYTLKQIAEKFGCDPSYVSYVYRGLR